MSEQTVVCRSVSSVMYVILVSESRIVYVTSGSLSDVRNDLTMPATTWMLIDANWSVRILPCSNCSCKHFNNKKQFLRTKKKSSII